MAPNCRSSIANNYSNVDDWKYEIKDNASNERSLGVDPYKTSPPLGQKPNEDGKPRACSRNCCRTTNKIPYGSHFPIGETLDSIGEWKSASKPVKHLEYGYEASWHPCRGVVPIKDIMEPCVMTPADVEFRPSIKVIPSGTGAWSEKWKPSKRYINPGQSKDFLWRSSVRTSHPHQMGYEMEYKPQVRPDPSNPSLETNQGYFKPIRRHLVPYTPIKQTAPYPQKRHIINPNEWVPPFRLQGEDYNKAPSKRFGRARVQEYGESHPPLCLAWEASHQPGSVPSTIDKLGTPSTYIGHGADPFASGSNGLRRNMRRYIPSGHLSHFENKNCCVCKVGVGDIERRTLRNHTASGPYHDIVADRNPIAGHMPETDVLCQPRVSNGLTMYGPAGSINSDIIDHKFSDLLQKRTPVSEMKDQYRRWKIQKDSLL